VKAALGRDEDFPWALRLLAELCTFLLGIPVACFQSLVLLPLTNFHFSPVCGVLSVPSRSHDAVCMFKWASAAWPYGIPMGVGGAISAYLSMGCFGAVENAGHPCAALLIVAVGLGLMVVTFMLLVTAAGMILFWTFGGVFVGLWFTFGSWHVLFDLALVKMLAGPSLVLTTAVMAHVFP